MTAKKTDTPPPAQTPASEPDAAPARPAARQRFRTTLEERRGPLTHAQIADDLAAFERAGGRIEVLGNTPMLRTIPLSPTPAPPEAQRRSGSKTPVPSKDE
ncbi:MAG: hypothetical protein ACOY82_07095 [Pseudomonadota bacterium]